MRKIDDEKYDNHEHYKDKLTKNKEVRKIFDDVFDRATLETIYDLSRKKYFDSIEYVIATGKEGNFFRCKAGDNFVGLKIYKIETSDFRHMGDYIFGDERFKDVRKDKLSIIEAWTRKEFKNLEEMTRAKIRVPLPIAFKRNCLVMEFVGIDGVASPKAKDKPFYNMEEKYGLICKYLSKMVSKKLIHADLSEYNILNKDEEMVIIDVGQGVSTMHPKAEEFFKRDVLNISKWFSKNGVDTNFEKMYEDIKKIKSK
jgi:RIO kinase 1